jgi:hypothetical protein
MQHSRRQDVLAMNTRRERAKLSNITAQACVHIIVVRDTLLHVVCLFPALEIGLLFSSIWFFILVPYRSSDRLAPRQYFLSF